MDHSIVGIQFLLGGYILALWASSYSGEPVNHSIVGISFRVGESQYCMRAAIKVGNPRIVGFMFLKPRIVLGVGTHVQFCICSFWLINCRVNFCLLTLAVLDIRYGC